MFTQSLKRAVIIFQKYFWLILILFLTIRGIVFLDPDFGWRLTTGDLILHEGIPTTDPFTYTMPSYQWINHAWLTDVLISYLNNPIGNIGLSLIFSLLTVGTIYIIFSLLRIGFLGEDLKRLVEDPTKVWYLTFPVLLLASSLFFRFAGIRAQTWTWFFMAVLLRLLFDDKAWSKFKIVIPLIFVLWVNLHGGFAAGLATLIFVVGIRTLKTKKIITSDLLVVLISTAATFINPYRLMIYKEVWLTLSDTADHTQVLEWNTYFQSFDIASLMLIALSTTLVLYLRRKLVFEEKVLFFIFLYQAFSTVRQIPLFTLIALPLTVKSLGYFYQEILKNKASKGRFKTVFKGLYFLSILAFIAESYLSYRGANFYSEKNFYPTEAVNYLKNELPDGEIFSKYDWGGYLIWKLPQKKVFIDGRMPFWRWQKGIPGETDSAMEDYLKISNGEKNYRKDFDKYDIKTVLWAEKKKDDTLQELEKKLKDNFGFLYNLLGIRKGDRDFIEDLEKDGWMIAYRDDISVIYKKPQ